MPWPVDVVPALQLNGTVPPSLGQLQKLDEFKAEHNNLTGEDAWGWGEDARCHIAVGDRLYSAVSRAMAEGDIHAW